MVRAVAKWCGRGVAVAVAWAAVLVLPNGLWLFRSTCEIRNRSLTPLDAVQLRVNDVTLDVGAIPPGGASLVLLPRGGDATLSVTFRDPAGVHHACHDYVEGSMYHVEVGVREDGRADCAVRLPLLSELLVTKLARARWLSRGSGA